MSNRFIIWFNDYRPEDRPRIGGKNAGLGEMINADLPVPPGFAVTTDGFETIRNHPRTVEEVRDLLAKVDFADPAGVRGISKGIRSLIEAVPMAADLEDAIRSAYAELCSRCRHDHVPVAVRSSATAEDLPDASFAGQQDTFLCVRGATSVIEHVKRCWSSLFTDRAMSYRHEMGHDHEVVSMSVAVQQMVDPKSAGVAFTLDPSTGDRSQVAIESSWGLGEAVVSGEVTPDNFLVDKVILEIHSRTISPKHTELVMRADGDGVEWCEVSAIRRQSPSVTDAELLEITRMAKAAERYFGAPQDVEWAVDRHLPEGRNVVMLQSRPETVWSRKAPRQVSEPASGFMDSIVSTLLSPIHTRGSVSADDGEA
ncbi:MAG: hypothetical protein J4G11_06975 [Acidimicrobiia bacterium]|nr:hypothetical protein [Acidimicrobiia bacterium]